MDTSTLSGPSLPVRVLNRTGLAAMLVLLVFSLVFYRERAWLLDVAFQTFLMIQEQTVQVMVYRFGAAVVQSLPLAAIRLEAPLWLVSMLYSAAFPLLYLGFFLVITRVLRQAALGMSLVLLYTLISFDGFYWATSELQQGLGFLLVLYAFVLRWPALDRWYHWAFIVPACVALAFYHPLVFIPFYFCWAFVWLWGKTTFRHRRFVALALCMAFVLVLKARFAANWYDTMKTEAFFNNLNTWGARLWEMPANRIFLKNCLYYWYGFPLLLGVLTWTYLRDRQWGRLGLVWLSCIAFITLVHIGDPDAAHRFYMEVSYMPLVVFVAVPFMLDVAPRWPQSRLLWFLGALLLLRLASIGLHHKPYTKRLHWLEQQLEQARAAAPDARRFWMPAGAVPADTLLMTWGTPYETLLLSASKHPDSARVLSVLADPGSRMEALQSDSMLVTDFKNYPLRTLNRHYWHLDKPGPTEALVK